MSERNTVVRSLHDIGLGAWFGGSLAGAVGINGAAADVAEPKERLRVASAGWNRWTPVNLGAIAAHLVGGAGLLYANKSRVASQKGRRGLHRREARPHRRRSGRLRVEPRAGRQARPVRQRAGRGRHRSRSRDPGGGGDGQRQLKVLQWVIPALTGGVVVLNALHGEQQRPNQQLPGIVQGAGQLVGATD